MIRHVAARERCLLEEVERLVLEPSSTKITS